MSRELYLGTTILRTDADGEADEIDVCISFAVASFSPGCPACYYQKNGDPGWPAEDPEWEFSFVSAEIDGHPGAAPLTQAELAALQLWFEANHARACEIAWDHHDDGPDPDEARERAYDDVRMGDRW